MNPFDLLINEHPINSVLNPSDFLLELNKPLDPLPSLTPPEQGGFSSKESKPLDLQAYFSNNAKKEKGFYASQSTADRYDNPKAVYDPLWDNEKIYSDNQSSAEAWGIQFKKGFENLKSFYLTSYIDTGKALREGAHGKFDVYSSLNSIQQLDAHLRTLASEFNDPLYRTGDESWYSPKGFLGDLVPSIVGYGLGGALVGLQDFTVGTAIKAGVVAAAATGTLPAAAIFGAALGGVAGLFSNKAGEVLGENTANYLVGAAAGGGLTAGGMGIVKGMKMALSEAAAIKAGVHAIENSSKFRKILDQTVAGNLAGIALDITKGIPLANLKSRLPQLGVTMAKNYMYSAAESGMEAMNAQTDYLSKLHEESMKKGIVYKDEELLQFHKDAVDMGKDVYNMNKIINTLFNVQTYGDVIAGAAFRANTKNLGILFKDGLFQKGKYALAKHMAVDQLVDSTVEGGQELTQLVISEASKKRLEEKNKSSYAEVYLKEAARLITSKEGLQEFLSGFVSTVGTKQFAQISRGIRAQASGLTGGQRATFKEGYTGVNAAYRDSIISAMNKNAEKIDKIAKSNKSTVESEDLLDEAIWDMFSYATKVGQQQLFTEYIKEGFAMKSPEMKIFERNTPEETQQVIDAAKQDILEKAERISKHYKNFIEYYSNPFTAGYIASKDKEDNKTKARIFDELVHSSARLLYTKENKINKANETRRLLDTQLNGSPIYEFFRDQQIWDFDSDGVAAFKEAIKGERFIIDSLSEKDPVRDKRLQLLERSVESFQAHQDSLPADQKIHPSLQKLYNPMLDYLVHVLELSDDHIKGVTLLEENGGTREDGKKVLNMTSRQIASKAGISLRHAKQIRAFFHQGKSLTDKNAPQRILESLYELQKVNRDLTLITNDLSNMMDESKQKEYINYLFAQGEKAKAEITAHAKSTPTEVAANVREKLSGVDADSQELYLSLHRLGLIDLSELKCD